MIPKIQIALDMQSIHEAIEITQKVENYIDVIEVGTILITACGKKAIADLAKKFTNKIIVADAKIADAGQTFATMIFANKAQYTTCICAAEIPTIKKTLEVAKSFDKNNDVQIELTSFFTFKQAISWKKIGIQQVVYHRSRDSQASGVTWKESDLIKIKKLCDMGFKVTITGGVSIQDIKLFKNLPIYIFIFGRTLTEAKNPEKNAKLIKIELEKYWS